MRKIPRLNATKRTVRTLIGGAIGLGLGGAMALLAMTPAIRSLERRLVDVRTKHYVGDRAPDPDLVLAVASSVDLEELKSLGYDWPWRLDINANAFRWMKEAGVKAVVVDMVHAQLGLGPEELSAEKLAVLNARETAEEGSKEADLLAEAYRKLGNVVLGYELIAAGTVPDPASYPIREPVFRQQLAVLPPFDVRPAFTRNDVNLPVVRLLKSARTVGFVNADVDDDGTLRRTSPVARLPRREVPSLALAAALLSSVSNSPVDRIRVDRDGIRIGNAFQRLDEHGTFLVNFRGGTDSYAQVRPVDMISAGADSLDKWVEEGRKGEPPSVGTAKPESVRGKIVLWGLNAAGLKDVVSVPIDRNFPGPEIQLTILDNLLHGDGRVEVSDGVNLGILLLLTLAVGLVGGSAQRRGVFIGATLALVGGLWLAGYQLFRAGWSIELLSPTLAAILTYAGVMAYRFLTEGRRNLWLEGAFSQYLSPAVIAALKSDPSMLELGGRRRELSIFFSDVKGFTTISEGLEPGALVLLLNDYLTRQSAQVLGQDGVIDKFIGDAVMAFFGDPVPYPDHALRACRAAVHCLAAVKESEPVAKSLGLERLWNRIGINSGPAIVGNMGSEKRFNYTCMGDTVNLASRLEGANKAFGSKILLGPLTYEQAKDHIVTKTLARLQVVGKNEPVPVYELMGLKGEVSDNALRNAARFAEARAAVLADDLDTAERSLDAADAARPGDGPVAWLRELVKELREGRRPRPWDGVFVLDAK